MKVIVFSLLMFIPLVSGGTSGFPLELMEPTDIQDIERLDYEVVRLNAKIKQSAHLLRLIHRPDVCLHSARFHCLHKVVVYDLDAVPYHRHLGTCRL